MEIVIAIELIAGSIFVAMFIRNLERELRLRSKQRLLALYGDEESDAAMNYSSVSRRRIG